VPHEVVILSRRPALFKTAANWRLPGVNLYVNDSPSEALAHFADGRGALLVFDTSEFARTRHVVEKFLTSKGDADLLVLGGEDVLAGLQDKPHRGALRRLDLETAGDTLRQEVERLLRLRNVRQRSGIVGRSRAVNQMIALIAQAAPLDVTILILGESGTGKELVARAIHDHSPRATGPFVSLNCGSLSEGVLESELFGHERGAFTGAVSRHEGVFRRADGGTLFLDEVAEMPLPMQTRFLRALETGEFTPVGGSRLERSDIRLVAATHRDLARDVEEGRFRQDLYYRLRVVVIPTPPLRERREDVPVLVQHFLDQENERHGTNVRGISRPALEMLLNHPWPGNVRELGNLVSSVVVFKRDGMIEAADLPQDIVTGGRARASRLPVPLARPYSGLDLELLSAMLLEMRQDLHEIKTLLRGAEAFPHREAVPLDGTFAETIPLDHGSTLEAAGPVDLESAERALIDQALRATGGRRRRAAERLGISERTLYRKLLKYGLS